MSRGGFTLAEIMVALLVVSIGLFALVALQIHSLRAQQGTTQRHTASLLAASLADEAVEQLEIDFGAAVDKSRQAATVAGYEFEIRAAPDPASALLKQLEVVVYWTDRQGAQQYRLATKVVKK
ncbi:MAG: prepilin-type N-terminal cleavage/methylation domain-containing protein [Chloroflexi bacterium]|nr:prepilin-type N-terminal cleavage/methylation domain-containing protein [Chloroflexota bacterium]